MKKIFLTICLMVAVLTGRAGGVLSISDLHYSAAHNGWGVEIRMDGDGSDGGVMSVCAMQFDVTIPSGFGYVRTGNSWAVVTADGVNADNVLLTTALRSDGTLRLVMASMSGLIRLSDGPVVFVPVVAAGGFTPSESETFKVNLTNQVMVSRRDDRSLAKTYPAGVMGDGTLGCYDSKGVRVTACGELEAAEAAELINDVATYQSGTEGDKSTIVTIDLSRCTSKGLGRLKTKQGANTMIFAASDDQVDNETNVFVRDENGVWRCADMVVSDDPDVNPVFELPYDAVADKFSYERLFAAGRKSTVVLPISLTKEQTAALRAGGMSLLRLAKYETGSEETGGTNTPGTGGATGGEPTPTPGGAPGGETKSDGGEANQQSVTFSHADVFEANTPYVVHFSAEEDRKLFGGLENVALSATTTMNPVTVGNMSMHGNYVRDDDFHPESENVVYYGYFASQASLGLLGRNCMIAPFRCYLELSGVSEATAAQRIAVREMDGTTGIAEVSVHNDAATAAAPRAIFTLDGRRLNVTDVNALSAGIYIVDGKKVVVR